MAGYSVFLLLALTMLLTGCGGQALRVSDRNIVPYETMTEEVKGARIIFAGEVHTEQGHHDLQLSILKAVHREGPEVAIALEMFTARAQPQLDAWSRGDMPESRFAELYRREWRNTSYELYAGILRYARDNRLRLVGLNVPREIVQKVARTGCASLDEEERAQLPEGTTCTITSEFRQEMQQVLSLHHGDALSLDNFCEAQMLRNSGMARVLTGFLESNPQVRVVAITGGGHALKRGGIPELLPSHLRRQSRVIIPAVNGITSSNVTTSQADYLLLDGSPFLLDLLAGY